MSVRVFFRQHGFIIAAIGLALAAVAAIPNGVTWMQQSLARDCMETALRGEDILRALEAQPLGAGEDFSAIAATLAAEARRQALSLELTHSLAAQLDGAAGPGGAPGVRVAVHELKRDIRHLIAAAVLLNALAAHEAEVRMLLGLDAEPANRNDGCRREAS